MTSPLASPLPILGVPQRPVTRSTSRSVLGGVCAGFAVRLGLREQTVRVLVSVSCLFFGVGFLLYALAWLFIPRWGEDRSIAQRLIGERRKSNIILVVLVFALMALFALGDFARHGTGALSWPLFMSAVAVVAIWFGSSRDEKSHLEGILSAAPVIGSASARGWRAFALRIIPAVILLVLGLQILRRIGGVWGGAVPAILGAGALALGLAILLAPWWLDNVRDLSRERRERVRIEERAKLIAHVHDSVLQTLTLIEKASESPSDVVRLARAQERELRQWLFAPANVVERDDAHDSFAHQMRQIENDVERDYGVTIEMILVGDCPGDPGVAALAAATREAAVNAAKWSQALRISIYGEVEAGELSVFVRDTGVGFDPEQVAPDRQGIATSMRERMRTHGGHVVIRSGPGSGTEVHLSLSRQASRI
jgi:signal transduction histidine kinase